MTGVNRKPLHQTQPLPQTAKALSNRYQAGLLTCNIFTILPIPQNSGQTKGKNLVLLTVARQSVIFTRFPINLQLSKTYTG